MARPIPKLIYSKDDNNKPFNIYHLMYISINDAGIKTKLYFYFDNGDHIDWKFPDKKSMSEALSEIYKVTDAVKI